MTEHPISFRVEPRHIEGATRGDSHCCPIARALAESVGAGTVRVAANGASFWLPPSEYLHVSEQDMRRRLVYMTDEAEQFMNDFDVGRPVQPFTFTSTFTIQD